MNQRYEAPFPEIARWWADRQDRPALVVIKCARGIPRCGKKIGEIKRDGEQTMALRNMVRPEPTVPRPQLGALNVSDLQDSIAERDRHVLKRFHTPEGEQEVMKQRRDLPAAVGSLDWWSSYFCPQHGEIAVDSGELAEFVAHADETLSVTQRTYWPPPPA